jgi:hypothetical protein
MATAMAGCIYSREIGRVKRALEKEAPDISIQRQITLSVGPRSIDFARWIVGMVDSDETERVYDYLTDVRRLKVSVYAVNGMGDREDEEIPLALGKVLEREGWELVARTHQDDHDAWLYYREEGDVVSDLYVAGVVEGELYMVRFEGNLNHIVARAMEDADAIPGMVGFRRTGAVENEKDYRAP